MRVFHRNESYQLAPILPLLPLFFGRRKEAKWAALISMKCSQLGHYGISPFLVNPARPFAQIHLVGSAPVSWEAFRHLETFIDGKRSELRT